MTRHDRAVRRYLFTLLTSDHAVDEVMQETALTLWEKIDEYDPSRPFFPWACRFAYFKVLEYRKRTRRDRLTFRQDVLDKIRDTAIEVAERQKDTEHALRRCLMRLNDFDRGLLRSRYEEGRRVVDLAEQYKRPVKHLYNRLDRLRQKLSRLHPFQNGR